MVSAAIVAVLLTLGVTYAARAEADKNDPQGALCGSEWVAVAAATKPNERKALMLLRRDRFSMVIPGKAEAWASYFALNGDSVSVYLDLDFGAFLGRCLLWGPDARDRIAR